MLRIAALLSVSAAVGVIGATSSACVIGLTQGTSTWCGFALMWPIGILFAIPAAVLLGLPADFVYRKAGLRQWWQFVIGGAVLSLPIWYLLAQPFESARWQASGFFDTLNYVGTGAFAGFSYWWLAGRKDGEGVL